jgi:Fe-S cluster assembly protein SufD
MNALMSNPHPAPPPLAGEGGAARTGNPVDWYFAEFERVRSDLAGADIPWLEAARRRALIRFGATGFPTLRDEDWKYTSLAPVENRTFRTVAKKGPGSINVPDLDAIAHSSSLIEPGPFFACHELVFINGHYCEFLSHIGRLPAGTRIESLAMALARQEDVLYEHIQRQAECTGDALEALNAAFMNDGAFIQVADGVLVEDPIHLLFLSTGEAVASHPRIVIAAGANARLQVVESYQSLGMNSGLTNTLTEVCLDAGAQIEHAKLQWEGLKSYHFGHLFVRQGRDSRLVSHSVSLGAALARHNIAVDLDGEGASAMLNGLYLAEGRQHVDHHTRIEHLKPHTQSEENYKGVLGGHARGVFNGKVTVHPQAQKSDARQSNKNLLLSADAEVDTKPELQINANDVKCSHGATVGQLDEDAIFYLRSRGMDKREAQGLLTYAFAEEVVSRIGIAPLRSLLETRLARQFNP